MIAQSITIYPMTILAWAGGIAWMALKVFCAAKFSVAEWKYPIWNDEKIQIQRRLHHKIRSVIRNFAFNPEWALIKGLAFIPVYLFTGKKYMERFLPWRIQRAPHFCDECKDKKRYKYAKGSWTDCRCKKAIAQVEDVPECKCLVCLDTHFIGPNKPCNHCEHRRRIEEAHRTIYCHKCNRAMHWHRWETPPSGECELCSAIDQSPAAVHKRLRELDRTASGVREARLTAARKRKSLADKLLNNPNEGRGLATHYALCDCERVIEWLDNQPKPSCCNHCMARGMMNQSSGQA